MTNRYHGRVGIGLALALTLFVAACGGGSATSDEPTATASTAGSVAASESAEAEPTPGTALTACEVLTAGDIEAALGLGAGTVAEGELRETPTVLDPAGTECRYMDEAWGGVIVDLTPTDGENLYDAAVGAYDDAELLDIGDGAFWSADTTRGFVWKGRVTTMIQIGFVGIDSAEWGGVAEELMTAVAGRV
jgi:hypothetical protein